MNFLSHIYLSGTEDAVQVGGFMADYVKGSKYNNYPGGIRFGILLHRKIDSFTDMHPAVANSIERFRPVYGKYAGVVTDMLFDHFLASDWKEYSETELKEFARNFYETLYNHRVYLPEEFLQYMPVFISKDRLSSYADLSLFREILDKMSKHRALPAKTDEAMKLIRKEYYNFKADFIEFFPVVCQYAAQIRKLRYTEPKKILEFQSIAS